MKKIFVILILAWPFLLRGQTAYEIPYLSKGNEIALTVANNINISLKNVSVQIINVPEWLDMKTRNETIGAILPGAENTVTFTFDVKRTAKINSGEEIKFHIQNNEVEYDKTITVKISAPVQYTLYQNYPNPFNPATKIEYDMPKENNVTLIVYDLLGRKVIDLVDEIEKEGHYSVEFNGRQLASGMYFYRIQAGSYSSVKKMLLLK
jgi:hypothetical protein